MVRFGLLGSAWIVLLSGSAIRAFGDKIFRAKALSRKEKIKRKWCGKKKGKKLDGIPRA